MAKVEESWLSSFAFGARPDLVFLKIAFYVLHCLQQLPHFLDLIGVGRYPNEDWRPSTGSPNAGRTEIVEIPISSAPLSLNSLMVLSNMSSDMRSIRLNRIWTPRVLMFSACNPAIYLLNKNSSFSAPNEEADA